MGLEIAIQPGHLCPHWDYELRRMELVLVEHHLVFVSRGGDRGRWRHHPTATDEYGHEDAGHEACGTATDIPRHNPLLKKGDGKK
jgi:hypothetical protein